MTLKVTDARLDVYDPGNDSDDPADADLSVTDPDFERIHVRSRVRDLVDYGTARIRNSAGTYTGEIRSGSRVRFFVETEAASLGRVWTGMVRNVDYVQLGAGEATLELELDDFVFGLLDTRKVVQAFANEPIAGTPSSIVNFALRQNAPEIGRSRIDTFTETDSPVYNGISLLKVAREAQDLVDALMWSDDRDLVFTSLDDLSPSFTLTSNDRGLARVTENDDKLANEVRVNGGQGSQLENEQTVVDQFLTVDRDTRLAVQVNTRKSAIRKVDIYTDVPAGSTDDLKVRIQSDTGGGGNTPIAPEDNTSDLTSKTLPTEFIERDGFTTVLLPRNDLPSPNPWLLIESTGVGGILIGADTSGVPAYKQYYPYPTAVVNQSNTSIQEYRRRERIVNRTAITDRSELMKLARSIAAHTDEPDREVKFPAESPRAHGLGPGDVITVAEPATLNFDAEAAVTTVSHTYEGVDLETTVTAQDVNTV